MLHHLEYKVLLCEPKIKYKNLAGGKAPAANHRVSLKSSLFRATKPVLPLGIYNDAYHLV